MRCTRLSPLQLAVVAATVTWQDPRLALAKHPQLPDTHPSAGRRWPRSGPCPVSPRRLQKGTPSLAPSLSLTTPRTDLSRVHDRYRVPGEEQPPTRSLYDELEEEVSSCDAISQVPNLIFFLCSFVCSGECALEDHRADVHGVCVRHRLCEPRLSVNSHPRPHPDRLARSWTSRAEHG
jgi:hypothetical protein